MLRTLLISVIVSATVLSASASPQEPDGSKKTDGATIKERYNQCLDKAVLHRASIIPPQSKRIVLERSFEDCASLELEYLGLNPEKADKAILTKQIKQHRAQIFANLKDNQTYYETGLGNSLALLSTTGDFCKNINLEKLKFYFQKIQKYFDIPKSALQDSDTFLEVFDQPVIEYKLFAENNGLKAWCDESKHKLKQRGVNDVFLE